MSDETGPMEMSLVSEGKLAKSFLQSKVSELSLIDKSQDDEINVDMHTSGFDNEALSVDACAV